MAATALRDERHEAASDVWLIPHERAATKPIAWKTAVPSGFGAMASSALLRGLRIGWTIRCAATPRIW